MLHSLDTYRGKFIVTFSFVGITSTLVFGVFVHFRNQNFNYALFELFLVILASLNLLFFLAKRNYSIASSTILAIMIAELSFLIYTGGHKGTGLVWVYTFPLLAFFMKGPLEALVWNVLLVISISVLLLLEKAGIVDVYYDYETLRQAFGAYLAVSLLSFFYSRIISNLVSSLRERAIKDPLTGLYNRAFVFESLSKIGASLSRRQDLTYCLIYIDLDNFKHVNDNFGHGTGDRVLRIFATILLSNFRKGDIISRIGGDEFIIIAHSCSKKSIERRLEYIKEVVEKELAPYGVSISYGVVEIPSEGSNSDLLMKLADRRMYTMKHSRTGQSLY